MSDNNFSRRGLNPNAQAFVPNPGARPFVPGQPYMYSGPPSMCGQRMPMFPVYQQMPPMFPPQVMLNTARMHYMQQQQYRPPPTQQPFSDQQQPAEGVICVDLYVFTCNFKNIINLNSEIF